MYEVPRGRLLSAQMLHATACRAIFNLGGHRDSPLIPRGRPPTKQEREELHLRNLFWICYKLDKDVALRTGQPPLINDDYCNLSLSPPQCSCPGGNCFETSSPGTNSTDSTRPPYGCRTIPEPDDLRRLDVLKSKACKLLYSADSSQKSDAELLRAIRELDDELESWRASLPPKCAPSLSICTSAAIDVALDASLSMLHIELHLQYRFLLVIIHSASSRCTITTRRTGVKDLGFGVQSSLELSVEASRSTLIYLTAAGHRIASEAFW